MLSQTTNSPEPTFAKLMPSASKLPHVVVFSDRDHDGWLHPISSTAIDVLRRLISAGSRGLATSALSATEKRALHDLEVCLHLGIRRHRKPGYLILAGTVALVDQRTIQEAA